PRRHSERDTSVGALLRRRLGRGATNALVAPLLAGIYAADIDRLSVEAAFPELAQWERERGSLRAGARVKAVPARRVPAGPATPRGRGVRHPAWSATDHGGNRGLEEMATAGVRFPRGGSGIRRGSWSRARARSCRRRHPLVRAGRARSCLQTDGRTGARGP